MVNENEEKSAPSFTTIKPANISLTATPGGEKQASPPAAKQPFIWACLVGLLLIAGLVFFLLPTWVATPKVGPVAVTEKSTTLDNSRPLNSPSTNTDDAPWQKAQRLQLRKETQDILAKLLDARKTLSEKGVTLWAAEEFNQALERATSGDDKYAQQHFSGARDEYAKALSILNKLLEDIEPVFEQAMASGDQALFDGNSSKAKAAFNVALAIDGIDRAALAGRQRAETLDEVIALIHKGDRLLQTDALEEAKNTYQKALAIDERSLRAREQLALVESKIKDRAFNQAMSSGFASLQMRQLNKARGSFREALKLRPNSVDARSGLNQADQRITANNIHLLLKQARELEEKENWADALSKYEFALTLDNNLANALAGKKRATTRRQLHDRTGADPGATIAAF